MRKLYYYSGIVIILSILWMILTEDVHIANAILGVFIGLVAILFTDNYLILGDYKASYQIHFFTLIRYIGFLFIQIYLSGFSSIRHIITGKTNVGIIEYESSLENELKICLLANSITLTPGTVTLDKKGNRLKILCLNCPKDGVTGSQEIISRKMEDILKSPIEGGES